ncbi:MAG TPA: putative monovalent cation/H+ antiporter subunit A [Gemmatimonadaceae bacterium]|nr:putative monovalent cation/H+ antiporter subunit A [Gemmatimonadaceae bacterium]
MTLPAAVLSVFALAVAAPWLSRLARGAAGWVLAILPTLLVVQLALLLPRIAAGETIRQSWSWAPTLGVELSFVADGLSVTFSLLILGIGALVLIYAGGYLAGHPQLPRFYLVLVAFMGAMVGLVLADNVVTLFVFWELTSITSYLLIGFDHDKVGSRKAALQALLVTGVGGLALLAAGLLLGGVTGSLELSQILLQGDVVRSHALYVPILLMVLAAAFTKSAQFPFHFWLPNAMQAPTPVSAYLHSATMVKAGVYLLARVSPVLAGTELWTTLVATTGAVTMVLGAVLALRQTDLKLVLAYSTVMALGTLVLLLGLGIEQAVTAAVVFLIVHSLYKGALFLIVGVIDYATGTRNVTRLAGLGRAMPLTTAAAVLAGLSMAGLPPLLGFISKELIYEATFGLERGALIFTTAAVLANAMIVAVTGLVAVRPFVGRPVPTPRPPREPAPSMLIGPLLLGVLGLLFGILPALVSPWLVVPAAASVLGRPVELALTLWHGVNAALVLSAVTVTLGFAGYLAWSHLHGALARADRLLTWGPAGWYERSLDGVIALAEVQTRLLQSGKLRYYLRTIFAFAAALLLGTLVWRGGWPGVDGLVIGGEGAYEWTLAGLMVLSTISASRATSRLAAITSLGVVGYSLALLFVQYGAPDLAMTQFLVETLVVIIVALVLIKLPHFPQRDPMPRRAQAVNLAIALAVGAAMTALMLAVLAYPIPTHVSEYFASEAYPLGHGRNIVNVILVDFRALDTWGEIMVLAIAGLGVAALVKLRLSARAREIER